jgi:glyoxalase family protein
MLNYYILACTTTCSLHERHSRRTVMPKSTLWVSRTQQVDRDGSPNADRRWREGDLPRALKGATMQLEGIHHITAITGDASGNVDFYTRILGLRLVKKTVNQDDPTVYHLFYADEKGSPGSDLTFFEYPGARPGRPGTGMVHRIVSRVGSEAALDFWAERLGREGIPAARGERALRFADPEGMSHELAVVATPDEPLVAEHPEIPAELALQGFDGVRAYAADPDRSRALLEETLGFNPSGDGWEVRGDQRGSSYAYDDPPAERGIPGAGTVHHVAWSSTTEDHAAWQEAVARAGMHPTPIIDRFWFRSVYFREPSGVLFELATLGPGFAVDEDPAHLGESLILPPAFEHLRDRVGQVLTPLPNPRADWAVR